MKKRFIFDENYIKKYAKKNKMTWLIVGVSVLVLIIVIIIVVLATRDNNPTKPPVVPVVELKEELIVDSGSDLPEAIDYFKTLKNVDVNSIEIIYPEEFEVGYDSSMCSEEVLNEIENKEDFNPEDYDCIETILKTPTTYGITIKVLEKEYTVNLVVVDETAPVILTNNVKIYEGDTYKIEDFIKLCFDVNDECNVTYYDKDLDDNGNIIDYSKISEVGVHTIKLIGTDKYNNVSDPVEVKLEIIEVEAPIYTITFNSNGGTEISMKKAEEGSVIIEPAEPTREGYKFLGWYFGDQKFDFATAITRNIILTAKWEKIQESTQGPSGGTGNDNPGIVNITGVSLDFSKIYVYVNESKTVKATIRPATATNKNVTWKSSDTSIATVSDGKITGVKAGSVTITATAGGKSDTVTVIVKEKNTGSICKYGDVSYNTSYILSVNLTQNNCAVNPNGTYNESLSTTDYQKMINKLNSMGINTNNDNFEYKATHYKVKNNSGTGLVGYQITINIKVVDATSPYRYMEAEYIIKSDGSRQFSKNTIEKNGVKFN